MNFLSEHALDIIVLTLCGAQLPLLYCLYRVDKRKDKLFDAMADHARECLHGWGKAIHIKEQYKDAAEFEARVAAKLAKTNWITGCNSNCPWSRMNPKDSDNCVHGLSFGFCELRNARLAVEEEMG